MLNLDLLERAIAWSAEADAADFSAARSAFEARTSPLSTKDADYESRISHFLEWYLCSPGEDAFAPITRYADSSRASDEATRRQVEAWRCSHRALIEVVEVTADRAHVRDLLRGGRYRVHLSERDRELYVGERFDGRLVSLGDELVMTPGRVYHPREVHTALDVVLEEARKHNLRDENTLDALLRMRARFLSFESIRAEHVYRFEALDQKAFAAPWARPKH